VLLGKTVEDIAAPDTAVGGKLGRVAEGIVALDRAVGGKLGRAVEMAAKQDNRREYKDLHRGLGNQTDCRHLLPVENSQMYCKFVRLRGVVLGAKLTRCHKN